MGVKVVNYNEKVVFKKDFPKLMISKNTKVIFLVSHTDGKYISTTLVENDNTSLRIGDHYITNLKTINDYWEDYNGPLMLQNE